MDRRVDVYDPFVRNSCTAGGLSSVSTYKHCAVDFVGGDSTVDHGSNTYLQKRLPTTVVSPGKPGKTSETVPSWPG